MQNKLLIVGFKSVLSILLLGLGNVTHARDYAVELIVFERLDTTSGANDAEEIWDFSSERIAGKLQKMHTLSAAARDYESSASLPNLAHIKNNLVDAGHGILHSASWIQPAHVYQNAPLISFGTVDSSLPYGIIRVYKTSLIFADIDIQYSPIRQKVFANDNIVTDANESENADSNGQLISTETNLEDQQPHFFISEKRRLKFKEIHYFDHPRFGVILSVVPSG